jgi:hypothetical protein
VNAICSKRVEQRRRRRRGLRAGARKLCPARTIRNFPVTKLRTVMLPTVARKKVPLQRSSVNHVVPRTLPAA